MRISLVVIVIALAALVWFNPNMDAFKRFVETRSEHILLQEAGEGALGRALAGVGGSLAGTFVDRVTERRNYLVFSIYTVDLDGEESDDEEWRFLGIAGQFVELNQPQAVGEQEHDRHE